MAGPACLSTCGYRVDGLYLASVNTDEAASLAVWEPWSPQEVADRLRGARSDWCIAGGWAIDLWLDRKTREHGDLEIAAPATSLPEVRAALPGYGFYEAHKGSLRLLGAGETPVGHQCWVLDRSAKKWRMDVLLEPGDMELWLYRRDVRVSGPRADIVGRTALGIPFLRPQVVLLFKAKEMRAKDESDFDEAAPCLDEVERSWLRRALEIAHPGHPWIERIDG